MTDSDLPQERLDAYLRGAIAGFGKLSGIHAIAGGQSNPTYRLETPGRQYVLRRKPFGELLKSAHAVEREFRVMRALADSDVPVPAMLHLCEDESVIGSVFFVMEFVSGRQFWDPALPELEPAGRAAVYDAMNRVLAALHTVDIGAVGLGDFGRPGNYYDRQVARWTAQYRASETDPIPAMDELIGWLPANLPADDGRSSLIHGDYRLDNLLFGANDHRAIALLDWELSTLGHPFADLAYQCMQLRMPRDAVIKGLAGSDRGQLGIPDEDEYVARYCARFGIDGIPDWTFYLVFGFFRFAAILQGVQKRALEGTAASDKAFAYGALAAPLAGMAVDLLEGRSQ